MGKIDWMKELGWTEEQLEDLRYAGYAYIRQGKYDVALPFFEALVVLNPESAYDAQTLGAILLQLDQPGKAAKALDKALKLETDHAPTLLNFTKALFMLGKQDEGLKLAHMLKSEPDVRVSNAAWALILAYE
ncbi:MAG: tetratricopeptide repeat protein [Chlamydiota bacterium]